MSPLEAEALLIRHKAAMTQVNHLELDDRMSLLLMIVSPSEDVLAASLQVAQERGASKLAREIAETPAKPRKRPSGPRPRAWLRA